MNNEEVKPIVVSIDDDHDVLRLINRYLTNSDYEVLTAESGLRGLELINNSNPDLILLDVMMPEMDGYEACAMLQQNYHTSKIPVIFVTALEDEQDKARAFAVGAVDYLVKPIHKEALLEKVGKHIETGLRWKKLDAGHQMHGGNIRTMDLAGFSGFLMERLNLDPEERELFRISSSGLYSVASDVGISARQVAQNMAEFLNLPYVAQIEPGDILLGILSPSFCRTNHVVPVRDASGLKAFVLSNPFDLGLLDTLEEFVDAGEMPTILISVPESIEVVVACATPKGSGAAVLMGGTKKNAELAKRHVEKGSIISMADSLLNKAVFERASDIHIETKKDICVTRFRIDGELKEFYSMENQTGVQLISRLKLLGGLDVAESRKPQDGSYATVLNKKDFNLRLSTTGTPNGESLTIRLLEPYSVPKGLNKLGMTDEQVGIVTGLSACTGGCILIVGPTGCGKTTTIYNLLHTIDYDLRSLISVEDPVEYRISFANQQQVNERAGVTFDALLNAAVRQDPDVLFIGEIRDPHSAKIAMDFASTGHLTITSLQTSNATTAVARLERVGINREAMSENIIGVIAQRLVKKLCEQCKEIGPISGEEEQMLASFTDRIPSQVARPHGCPVCNNSGYYGCEAVYETVEFDGSVSEMIRSGTPISEIRYFARNRGDFLISTHAVEKVRDLLFSPADAYEKVLVEEIRLRGTESQSSTSVSMSSNMMIDELEAIMLDEECMDVSPVKSENPSAAILVVDSYESDRSFVAGILGEQGYSVSVASDGMDAMLSLDKSCFDLVIADIDLPNLDGLKLAEVMIQKGIDTPVMFLSSRDSEEDEEKGL
ncbi:MAG: Flp pilus assembly complex ATPase component TadA [Chloroflexi bacterium]|jgi:type IV pilus assembly protein PilB|nr:Flp pilus assembly complex ATPase component TadA [Chloroflexota bacterium]